VKFDVAVIGAGPAGSSAALALSAAGMRVAIVEKAHPPRYKTCGGGVLARARRLLPVDFTGVVECDCLAAELHHHSPHIVCSVRRETPIVSMVMRDRFDHLIMSAAVDAGAELMTGQPVTDIVAGHDSVEVRTPDRNFRASHVIAADGVNSLVARKARLPELQCVIPALEYEVVVDPPTLAKFQSTARFDFGLTPGGYAWVFPKRAHLSIGVLTTRRRTCNLNDEYARYYSALGIPSPLSEERHGYMIPVRPRAGLFDAPRILPVGDAAGLADPVTAEGISNAISSGQLAAKAILEGHADEAMTRRAYCHRMQGMLADLRIARALARILYDFPRLRIALLGRHGQGLAELLTRIVTGETTYREAIRSPRNYLKLFRR
jgi:geranylgeranyl reductase family protein